MSKFSVVLIQGVGLIGGAFARRIAKIFPEITCIGVDTNKGTLDYAIQRNLISKGYKELKEVIEKPDLVLMCTPLETLKADIIEASNTFDHKLILTDVGSVKGSVAIDSEDINPLHVFIPGHPMAGTEKTGVIASGEVGLENASHLLVLPKSEEGETLEGWLRELGLLPVWVEREHHDKWVAIASHVPYMMACLTAELSKESKSINSDPVKDIVSTGFRDTTRVASMDPKWGVDICTQNKHQILENLDKVTNQIAKLRGWIELGDEEVLGNFFTEVKQRRDDLFG